MQHGGQSPEQLCMQVRKLAKQAAVDAREAALAAEEVQCMAAQLAARHAPTALEAGPPVCDRVRLFSCAVLRFGQMREI